MENSERDGNTRPPDLPLEKPICRSESNSSNWTWNNRLVSNRKRSTVYPGVKAVYCHPAYLTYMQSHENMRNAEIMRNAGLEEAQKKSRLPGEISITSDMQMTPPLWQKVKKS